jgi:RNA polymerase sigma-70 factor, ECF subfamily
MPTLSHAAASTGGSRTPCASTLEEQFACYARTGCSRCFRAVYDEIDPLIRSRVAAKIRDADDAEDLTSSIFARILRARSSYDPSLPLLHWVNRIVTNAIHNAMRDSGRSRTTPFSYLDDCDPTEIPAASPTPDQLAEHSDLGDRIRSVLSGLPASFGQAFDLHHLRGMTYAHAGEELGVQPGTVKTRAFRACRSLERAMGPQLREFLLDRIHCPA